MEGRSQAESRPLTAAEVRDNLLGHARGDLNLFLDDEHFYSKYMDSLDVSLRPQLRDIIERQIEALSGVDTEDTSAEEVRMINMSFHEERSALEKEILGG